MTQTEIFDKVIMRFIEAHVELFGYVSIRDISKAFGLQRQKASRVMRKYKDFAGTNVYYNTSESRYNQTIEFKRRVLGSEDVATELVESVANLFNGYYLS